MKRFLIISSACLILVAAITAVAGCGGGGSDSSASNGSSDTTVTTSSTSKAEFVKLANAICKRDKANLLTEMGLYAKEHPEKGQSQEEILATAIQAVFVPKVQTQIGEIRALGAPSGDEKEIEAFLVALQEGADAGEAGPVKAQGELAKDFKRSAALASKYGLDECAYGG